MINRDRLIRLTRKLIQIDSQNPPGNEARIAGFVRDYLVKLSLKTKIYEFKKQRCNVVAVLKGKNESRSLLITPHLDTIPSGKHWHFPPFSALRRGGKIYGLGATDCKGNLGVAIEAINSIVEEGVILGYNLIFAATADEESGSGLGLIPLLDRRILKPDAAVVLDADDFEIIIVQKGLIHLKIEIQGKKAHGAYPWRGINAIDIAVEILRKIKKYKFIYQQNKYLRPPTVNIGTIRGGDKVNVVADWCEFELDLRFLPGMSAGKILADIKGIAKTQAKNFKIEIEGIQKPYWINERHLLVDYLTRAMKKMKIKPRIKGSEGATVITFFQDQNIPTVATGFGCAGCAHMRDEYAKVENLYQGALVLEEFIKTYHFNT